MEFIFDSTGARKQQARIAAIENYLSDEARHFIRCNPDIDGNEMAMKALEHMDGCFADYEDRAARELEKESDLKYENGELFALEQFRELLDAAMCLIDDPENAGFKKELYAAAARCEKYRKNLEDK